MARDLEMVSDAATDGQVFAASELAATPAGRELTRRALEAIPQRQADGAEKEGVPSAPAPAASGSPCPDARPEARGASWPPIRRSASWASTASLAQTWSA